MSTPSTVEQSRPQPLVEVRSVCGVIMAESVGQRCAGFAAIGHRECLPSPMAGDGAQAGAAPSRHPLVRCPTWRCLQATEEICGESGTDWPVKDKDALPRSVRFMPSVELPKSCEPSKHGAVPVEIAEDILQISYAPVPIFENALMLRNYPFWGMTPAPEETVSPDERKEEEGAENAILPPPGCPTIRDALLQGAVHEAAAIGRVPALSVEEGPGMGLFATERIEKHTWVVEYTGVVRHVPPDIFDAYGVSYPSLGEGSAVRMSAAEFGNEARCINHSSAFNVALRHVFHDGVIRLAMVSTRCVEAGEQLFADYGEAYWKASKIVRVDIEPA